MLAYALTPELQVETDRSLELAGQLQVRWENLIEKIKIEKDSQSALSSTRAYTDLSEPAHAGSHTCI